MNLREQILSIKPKVRTIKVGEQEFFIREFNVGEMNQHYFGQQQQLYKLAEEQGIELDLDDEAELTKQLAKVYDPYKLARTLASRLCDKEGNNIFDINNKEDLEQLSKLDKSIFSSLESSLLEEQPKNSQPDVSSK
ncbi:Uncharacterised protein [Phocoenobacter uteri]|uniref:Uncharacterized protein n=1 Tax=Phocoenobacter uteri TaxID=146806 RepID=A0A379C9A6_9PAST|nr:hypothetical protein [Phocoenobacter uteri]MDG6880947.1 hypothetical protein [Phocoenobacter uteri]MDG6882792.1 hypothetical protein [Phocoenobacter uteri]SUB58962.1 Uncharacterised protein [Phocoenobacter uteri]